MASSRSLSPSSATSSTAFLPSVFILDHAEDFVQVSTRPIEDRLWVSGTHFLDSPDQDNETRSRGGRGTRSRNKGRPQYVWKPTKACLSYYEDKTAPASEKQVQDDLVAIFGKDEASSALASVGVAAKKGSKKAKASPKQSDKRPVGSDQLSPPKRASARKAKKQQAPELRPGSLSSATISPITSELDTIAKPAGHHSTSNPNKHHQSLETPARRGRQAKRVTLKLTFNRRAVAVA